MAWMCVSMSSRGTKTLITLFTKLQKLQTDSTKDSQTILSCASVTDILEDTHHGCLNKSTIPV